MFSSLSNPPSILKMLAKGWQSSLNYIGDGSSLLYGDPKMTTDLRVWIIMIILQWRSCNLCREFKTFSPTWLVYTCVGTLQRALWPLTNVVGNCRCTSLTVHIPSSTTGHLTRCLPSIDYSPQSATHCQPSAVYHPRSASHHLPFNFHRLPFTIYHSPYHPPSTVHYLPSVHHRPSTLHQPPSTI